MPVATVGDTSEKAAGDALAETFEVAAAEIASAGETVLSATFEEAAMDRTIELPGRFETVGCEANVIFCCTDEFTTAGWVVTRTGFALFPEFAEVVAVERNSELAVAARVEGATNPASKFTRDNDTSTGSN